MVDIVVTVSITSADDQKISPKKEVNNLILLCLYHY